MICMKMMLPYKSFQWSLKSLLLAHEMSTLVVLRLCAGWRAPALSSLSNRTNNAEQDKIMQGERLRVRQA